MNEQDIVNKLKSDPRALKSVMQSQDGQALLRMLSGGDSAALGQAARQAASGDTAALSAMLSRVLSSPQGAELVQRLENKAPAVTERRTQRGQNVDEKLNALLSDPGSMAQIMQLAQQLSGSMGGEHSAACRRHLPRLLPRPRRLRRWAASIRRSSPDTCRSCRS